MSAATLLLRRLLEEAGGASESGFMLVIESEGLEDLPEQMVTAPATYQVHRASTELGLRHLLWKARGAPLIAVLPETLARRIQSAPDLLRRAYKKRVHALLVNDVLEVVLGVRVVGAETPYLQELAMEHIHQLGLALSHRTLPTVVDRRLLTELLVDVSVGEQVRTRSPAQLLAAWVKAPPVWSHNISQLVREALPTLHGDEGRVLAWGLVEPEPRLSTLLVRGCVLSVAVPELSRQVWGPLWQAAQQPPLETELPILRRTLTRLAEETLTHLGDGAAPWLDEANRIARECLTPNQVESSRILPLAFENRAQALARQAAAGKPIAAADMKWLAEHGAASMHGAELKVLEALARVSRYLDQPFSLQTELLEQVNGYLSNGAFADRAALHLRRALAGSANYHAESGKVLQLALVRREHENLHFARTLAQGYEKAVHGEGLIPLHRIWKRLVAPMWQNQPEARLFLVVLDGCSYATFLDLLHDLASDNSFPLGIRPAAEGPVMGMPGMALLPTVTSHSRGALFLGEIPKDPLVAETVFRDQEEAKTDRARFSQNAQLGTRSRRLFLKGDLTDGGQSLMAALRDSNLQVVACVFNAIDDQIGSSNTGASLRVNPEDIAAFKPALRVALEARMQVLVTADHGHSLFLDKKLRAGAGKAPRYVALEQAENPPEGFLEIDLAALGGPPQRRAFAWKTGTYLGMPQVGFHGGCALEEMAVPLAWLDREGLDADLPLWWYGHGAKNATPPPKPQAPSRAEEPSPPPTTQLTLFNPAERADRLPLPQPLVARLESDALAVLVLLQENGSARASELAAALNKNPMRLNGLMRALRRTLHSEGFVLFSDEVLPSGETLYRFGLKEVGDGTPS